jgi:hypothetical protein
VGAGCRRWYTKGGLVKREAEAAHGTDEDVGAARDTGYGAEATRGAGRGTGACVARAGALVVRAGAVRGLGRGAGATCGATTGSELPAMEEG